MLRVHQKIEIHKYSNRKYYSLTDRKYLSLEHMAARVCQGHALVVTRKEDGEDVTVDTLATMLATVFRTRRPSPGKQLTVQQWLQDTIRHCWSLDSSGQLVSDVVSEDDDKPEPKKTTTTKKRISSKRVGRA